MILFIISLASTQLVVDRCSTKQLSALPLLTSNQCYQVVSFKKIRLRLAVVCPKFLFPSLAEQLVWLKLIQVKKLKISSLLCSFILNWTTYFTSSNVYFADWLIQIVSISKETRTISRCLYCWMKCHRV